MMAPIHTAKALTIIAWIFNWRANMQDSRVLNVIAVPDLQLILLELPVSATPAITKMTLMTVSLGLPARNVTRQMPGRQWALIILKLPFLSPVLISTSSAGAATRVWCLPTRQATAFRVMLTTTLTMDG
jgi:hypothetical protein